MPDVKIFVLAEGTEQTTAALAKVSAAGNALVSQNSKIATSFASANRQTQQLGSALSRTTRLLGTAGLVGNLLMVNNAALQAAGAVNALTSAVSSPKLAGAALKGGLIGTLLSLGATAVSGGRNVLEQAEALPGLMQSNRGQAEALAKQVRELGASGKLSAGELAYFRSELEKIQNMPRVGSVFQLLPADFGNLALGQPTDAENARDQLARIAASIKDSAMRSLDKEKSQADLTIANKQLGGEQSIFEAEKNNVGALPEKWAEYNKQLDDAFKLRQAVTNSAFYEGLISEADQTRELITLGEQRLAADRRYYEAVRALREQQLAGTQDMFNNMAIAAKAFGREGFIAFKAFAIASATVSTYSSAVKAYESVVGIPYVGPFIAPVAAAAAIAAGAANIAQIASQTYRTGGHTGTGAPNEVAGIVHKGEYVMPAPVVDRLGLPVLEAIRQGRMFADGGYTGDLEFVMPSNSTAEISSPKLDPGRAERAGEADSRSRRRRPAKTYNYFNKSEWANAVFSSDEADQFVEQKIERHAAMMRV